MLLAVCLCAYYDTRPVLEGWRIWRRFRGIRRWLALAFVVSFVAAGADKAPPLASSARMIYLTIMASGELRGPTNVIASAAATYSIQAVVDDAAHMAAVASNILSWAEADIPVIEDVVGNTVIGWITGDIPQDLASSNVVARCDLVNTITQTNGNIDAYVVFNITPSSAPIVAFEAAAADGVWYTFTPVSNSFPSLVGVSTPGGIVSGYVYTVATPDALAGITLVPERGMTFGGGSSNAPLGVLGAIMVGGKIGRTVETAIAPGVIGRFDGGILVGVL
jgi:ABC-type iron transport system FetAB permease component